VAPAAARACQPICTDSRSCRSPRPPTRAGDLYGAGPTESAGTGAVVESICSDADVSPTMEGGGTPTATGRHGGDEHWGA